MGFGLARDAIHSPNEHSGLFNIFKGIETIPLFDKHYVDLVNADNNKLFNLKRSEAIPSTNIMALRDTFSESPSQYSTWDAICD